MLTTDEQRRHAHRLSVAEATVTPIPPIRGGAMTVEDAYAIQIAGRRLRTDAGERLVGRKIGLTSQAMQAMLGVDQPDFGYLTDRMQLADGAALPVTDLIAPRAEAEIAFRVNRPLSGSSLGIEEVMAATAAVAPAIEVIDSRIADWDIAFVDTVADNASSACFVIGEWRPVGTIDLPSVVGTMTIERADGSIEESSGPGAAVLGHPANAIAWLSRAIGELADEGIAPGEVVIPGAVSKALPLRPGDRVTARFEGLGDVSLITTEEEEVR